MDVSYHIQLSHTSTDCARRCKPPSALDLLNTNEDVVLYSDKPFVEGDDSDECEEEVDDDDGTELEAYYKSMPNEYETDE